VLNQGPELLPQHSNVYLFISFGKRYNDPRASCFLVLLGDAAWAQAVFKSTYSHFMPRDFQLVDTSVSYHPNPLFTTQIPMATRYSGCLFIFDVVNRLNDKKHKCINRIH